LACGTCCGSLHILIDTLPDDGINPIYHQPLLHAFCVKDTLEVQELGGAVDPNNGNNGGGGGGDPNGPPVGNGASVAMATAAGAEAAFTNHQGAHVNTNNSRHQGQLLEAVANINRQQKQFVDQVMG
jgi:hypothetical protein